MSDTIKAVFWMTGAIVSFSAMAVGGREVSFELDTFEIMLFRSCIGVAIVIGIGAYANTLSQINTNRIGLHAARNLFHFTGQNLWFYALTLIPFAQLFAFEFSVPIWVTLAAPFLLGERLGAVRVASVFLGFFGILIVTRPWMAGVSPGLIAAALCAIGFAGTTIMTKKLTATASITCIMFWLTLMQLVFGLICAGYDGDIALPSAASAPWIAIIGIGGLVAHFCITRALQLADASVVSPIDFTRLPIIAVIGYVFYSEPLDIWIIVGAVVIFVANYVNILSQSDTRSPR